MLYSKVMKQCRYCSKFYPESYFGVALTTPSKVYRRHKCRFCYRVTKNILKKKYKQWIIDYKERGGCDRCKITDSRVLEFHHLDGKNKDFEISQAPYNPLGLERMKKEIKKCVILCANCHRIAHWEKNNQ